MSGRLAGKFALVTGCANGIGKGCAEAFTREGATVVGVDRAGGDYQCDLLNPAAVAELVKTVKAEHGRIDILVNAAAFAVFKWIEELSLDEWKATLSGELDIVFLLTKACWPLLKASGNSTIINFASANAHMALTGSPALAHTAGKGGILAMTRQLAMEGAPYGIRANSISPGFIRTAATEAHMAMDPGFEATVLARNMIKRLGIPEDVAMCAVWLASDEASYVTGAEIPVDAGATAW